MLVRIEGFEIIKLDYYYVSMLEVCIKEFVICLWDELYFKNNLLNQPYVVVSLH